MDLIAFPINTVKEKEGQEKGRGHCPRQEWGGPEHRLRGAAGLVSTGEPGPAQSPR